MNETATEEQTDRQWLHRRAEALSDWAGFADPYTDFYDISVYRADGSPDSYRVEFLLAGGGPTTRVITDTRYRAELWTSEGPEDSVSYNYRCHDMTAEQSEIWDTIAERVARR